MLTQRYSTERNLPISATVCAPVWCFPPYPLCRPLLVRGGNVPTALVLNARHRSRQAKVCPLYEGARSNTANWASTPNAMRLCGYAAIEGK